MSIADHHNVNLVPSGSLHSQSVVQGGEGCIVSRARGKKGKKKTYLRRGTKSLLSLLSEILMNFYSAMSKNCFQILDAMENRMNIFAEIIIMLIVKQDGVFIGSDCMTLVLML